MASPDSRLLLAKYLYTRGSDILRDGGIFDPGLAVSLFQDAVEILVLACGATVNASPKDKSGFVGNWDDVNKALIAASKPPLPMRIEMEVLNKARVSFKHAGLTPDPRVAETCRIDAGEFLERMTKGHFGLFFSSLSIVSFVPDLDDRIILAAASSKVEAGDMRGALEGCAVALERIGKRQEQFYAHHILVQMPQIDHNIVKYVKEEITDLRRQIWDLEGVLYAEACGVSLSDLFVVRRMLPARGDNNEFEFRFPLEAVTAYMANRCVEFLAQYSIGLSRQLDAPLGKFSPAM